MTSKANSLTRKDCEKAVAILEKIENKNNNNKKESVKLKTALDGLIPMLDSREFMGLVDVHNYYVETLKGETRSWVRDWSESRKPVIKGWPEIVLDETVDDAIKEMLDDAIRKNMEIKGRYARK